MPQDSAFLSAAPHLWVQTSHKTLGGFGGHQAMFGLKGSLDVHLLHRWVFYGVSWCRLVLLAMYNVGILQHIDTTITNNIKYRDTGCQVLHSAKKPCFLNAFHPPVSSGSSFPARCRQSVHVIWHSEFCFWIIVNFVTSLQKKKTFSIFWMDCLVSLFFDVTPLVMTSSGFSLCNTCHSMWWREPSHHPLVPSGSCQRYNCMLTWGLMKPPC